MSENKQGNKKQQKKGDTAAKTTEAATTPTNPTPATSTQSSGKQEVAATPTATTPENGQTATPANNNAEATTETPKEQKKQPQPRIQHREKGRGVVKGVLSGDTLLILNVDKNQHGLPVEREITISNIKAPSMGRRASKKNPNVVADKPYAWQAREFLRKKCIGRQVIYVIESKSPNGDRYWGSVILLSKMNPDKATVEENLASEVIKHGWAEVKKPKNEGRENEELEALLRLQEEAKRSKLGIHGSPQVERALEEVNYTEAFGSMKGAQTVVVENVRYGHSLRVTLFPSLFEANLSLSGVECPGLDQNGNWDHYSREAIFFSEYMVLHHEVQVIIEGVDKKTFYGSVSISGKNLAIELLSHGLGRFVEWSGNKSSFAEKLRNSEKEAQDKKLRIWNQFVAPKPLSKQELKKANRIGKEISGKVVEISLNGGSITVLTDGNNPTRVSFSSVRIPRPPVPKPAEENKEANKQQPGTETKDQKMDAFERYLAFEVREFLRKRVMGQKVRCILDYTRQIKRGKSTEEEPFFSVYIEKNNIAVELAEQGLAQASEHRMGEPRSRDFEHILLAEERARSAHRGLWTPENSRPGLRFTDLSLEENREKAKLVVGSFKTSGKMRGIVEYVFSGNRYKILIPKENLQIIFAISGIRCPRRDESDDETLFPESVQFAKDLVLLKDVEVEVTNLEKGSNTFNGNIFIGRNNVATKLLEAGFAQLNRMGKDSENFREYSIAEEEGKRLKKKMWKNYDPVKEEEERNSRQAARKEQSEKDQNLEKISVIVTEILDASKFYVQKVSDGPALDDLAAKLNANSEESTPAFLPRRDDVVKAKFSSDDKWYRARVLGVSEGKEVQVFYVDYGNSETVSVDRVRKLDENLSKLSFYALPAKLSFVRPVTLKDEFGMEAAEFFRDQVDAKTLNSVIDYEIDGIKYLSLGDTSSSAKDSVNAALIRNGYARLERTRTKNPALVEKMDELSRELNFAKQRHIGIWQYGDPGSDDEREETPRTSRKNLTTSSSKTQNNNNNASANAAPSGAEGKQEK